MRRLNSDEIVTFNTRILRSLRNAARETVMYELRYDIYKNKEKGEFDVCMSVSYLERS